MVPQPKISLSSGSKKRTQIYYSFFSKGRGKRIPSRLPSGAPRERDSLLQGILHLSYYISYCLSLRVPGKVALSVFPNRVSMDRNTPSPEPLAKRGDSIHSFIRSYMFARVQKKDPSYIRMGKNQVAVPGEPPQMEGLHTMRCGLVPPEYR